MGGKSKSSNTTSTTTVTEHNTDIDSTSMMGDGTFVQGDGNIIHSSDAEVLKHLGTESMGLIGGIGGGVADLASKAFDGSERLGKVAGNLGSSAFSSANRMSDSAFNFAGDSNRTMSNLASDANRNMSNLAGDFGAGAFGLADNVSNGLMQLAARSNQTAADSSKSAMDLVNNFTEREQLGLAGSEINAMKMVAVAAVATTGFMLLRGK